MAAAAACPVAGLLAAEPLETAAVATAALVPLVAVPTAAWVPLVAVATEPARAPAAVTAAGRRSLAGGLGAGLGAVWGGRGLREHSAERSLKGLPLSAAKTQRWKVVQAQMFEVKFLWSGHSMTSRSSGMGTAGLLHQMAALDGGG